MKFITLIFSLITFITFSQYCPLIGPDLNLPCGVTQTTLTADLSQCGQGANPNGTSNYNVSQITYVPQTNNGTLVQLTDDSQSGVFNIGFTFCYYGQIFTQFRIGSNGWVSLGAGVQPANFTSMQIPTPNAAAPKNCIMGPWQDWNPGIGGQIRYQVQGVAPCRKLVVSWVGVPMYSCTNLQGTFHIVLYESTNVIENYIANKPNCPQWAQGTAVQGIHNLTGTQAVTVAGRNSTQWTTVNDARRYTPSGPVVLPVLTWYQVGNPVSIGTGQSITVTPPVGGAYYTCHLEYGACNAGWSTCNQQGVGLGPDTIHVVPTPVLPTPNIVVTNPLCNDSCNGSATVVPVGGVGPFIINWNGLGNNLTLNNLCEGTYNFTLTDANNCNFNGSATLIDPAALLSPTITPTNPTCFGYCDGSAVVNPIDGIAPYTFLWSNNQNTQNATNLCSGNYSVLVIDANNCPATQTTVLNDPPQVIINPITGSDTVCFNSLVNQYNVFSPTLNLTYNWSTLVGNISQGQGTNQINLDVNGVSSGLYTNLLTVIGENQLGCQSQPQTFTVYVLNILPQITPVGPFCEYDNCINLIATPPNGIFAGLNVWGGEYCPDNGFIGVDTVSYTYNQSGCWFFDSIQVQVYPRPNLIPVTNGTVGENTEYHQICQGDTITDVFGANSASGGYNEWYHFGDTTQSQNLNITWNQDGIFQFQVVRWDNGCVSNPENFIVTVELCPNEIFYIPNTFTPDDDQYNQYFQPIITSGVDIHQFHFLIYNRWGETVWESFDSKAKWDGTYNNVRCQDGVYTWVMRFGVPETDEIKEYYGYIQILK
jgi:gliding motility-associated-like protein